MYKIQPNKFSSHFECLDFLDKLPERTTGIYILANDKYIRPGMGFLITRLRKHLSFKKPRTKKLDHFYGEHIKYILLIPLKDYFADRFIYENELKYIETKLIEKIEKGSPKCNKKNLSNISYIKNDLHKNQVNELDILFGNTINWIDENWNEEFYGFNKST